VPYNLTSDGKVDIISMLYNDENIPPYPDEGNLDPYGVAPSRYIDYNDGWNTDAIKILLPSGAKNILSTDAGEILMYADNYGPFYRALLRGYA